MNEIFSSIDGLEVIGLPVGKLITSLSIIVSAFILQMIVGHILKKIGKKDKRFVSDFAVNIRKPLCFLIVLIGIYITVVIHLTSESALNWVGKAGLFLFTLNVIWILLRTIDAVGAFTEHIADGTSSKMDDQIIPILRKAAKFVIIAIGILFFMQANGYPISGLLAGMGIGGIAVAMAAQDSISGIFASIVIFLDKPFMIDDFVQVGGITGTVEEIGLRSTRIRTVDKTLVTIPNKQIMDSNIDNFSKRPRRRTTCTIGVTYDTTPEQMKQLLARLREMLVADGNIDTDTLIVNFTGFGDSALNIDMKFFMLTADYGEWLNMQESINLKIMDIVHELGLDFAFPSTTVYLQK